VEEIHSLKAIEQNFSLALFIMLYKMVLSFDSVEEIPYFEHLHEVKALEQNSPVQGGLLTVWIKPEFIESCCAVVSFRAKQE